MNVARHAIWTFVSFGFLSAGVALADGWSIGNWLPGRGKAPAIKTVNKGPSRSHSAKNVSTRKPVGMVDALTAAPKKFYSGTKAMLSPNSKTPTTRSGHQTTIRHNVSQSSSAKPSMLEKMFAPPEPYRPRTVQDWMKQKRLDP